MCVGACKHVPFVWLCVRSVHVCMCACVCAFTNTHTCTHTHASIHSDPAATASTTASTVLPLPRMYPVGPYSTRSAGCHELPPAAMLRYTHNTRPSPAKRHPHLETTPLSSPHPPACQPKNQTDSVQDPPLWTLFQTSLSLSLSLAGTQHARDKHAKPG